MLTSVSLQGANPYQSGVRFPNFPAPPTRRPPVQSPPPCVWAIIQCCPSNQRLVTCFESLGCPGVNWDSNPCRDSVSQAARAQVEKFYRETEDEEEERYWEETRKCRLVDSVDIFSILWWGAFLRVEKNTGSELEQFCAKNFKQLLIVDEQYQEMEFDGKMIFKILKRISWKNFFYQKVTINYW